MLCMFIGPGIPVLLNYRRIAAPAFTKAVLLLRAFAHNIIIYGLGRSCKGEFPKAVCQLAEIAVTTNGLASQHHPSLHATKASDFTTSSYNMCYTVAFEDGYHVLVQFPIMGRSRFRSEKTRDELLVMAFLARNTRLPVPIVLGTGNWGCGPYIVMTFIEGTLLSKCLRDPTVQSPSLDPTISESSLQRAYYAMAQVVLELSKPTFPSIGALKYDSDAWKVGKRPLTLNMNELVRVGNCPPNRMSSSMENGLFWFCLAARKSIMFDDIYWTFLDEKYFGHLSSLDDRLSLLTEDERNELDGFVRTKKQQAEEKTLDEHMTLDEIIDL
ncbi:hypothetical protein B7463_g10973, partial [Scytalidium lignicola]